MTEQDFKSIIQTEIGALAAAGKSETRLCMALKETLGWMDSTAYQGRKRNYTKKDAPQERKEETPVAQGAWVRPEGATPKSYKWVCSQCGKAVNFVPLGKKGTEAKCDFAYCPWCGDRMEGKEN